MRNNPLQFAVVREDPRVERAVLKRFPAKKLLLIGSGGCTALALRGWFPELSIDVLDPNPAQLDLIRKKIDALQTRPSPDCFNISNDSPKGLSQCGNFESLFRMFRCFIEDLVLPRDHLLGLFQQQIDFSHNRSLLTESPYWPVAFQLAFHDALLLELFGPNAVQYAPQGSYPRYFQHRFEEALARPDAVRNPFLHHILLGHYLPSSLPDYLVIPPQHLNFQWIESSIQQVSFEDYDWIGLSNILDWTSPEDTAEILSRLCVETSPGTTVIWRQLNNNTPIWKHLSKAFDFDPEWESKLLASDRSFFYSQLHVGHRRDS